MSSKANYTIQCFVKKVVLKENGVKSLTIRPTGKSRIEEMEDRCLGWGSVCEPDTGLSRVRLFNVEAKVASLCEVARSALLGAKSHGCEVELVVERVVGTDKVNLCGCSVA